MDTFIFSSIKHRYFISVKYVYIPTISWEFNDTWFNLHRYSNTSEEYPFDVRKRFFPSILV